MKNIYSKIITIIILLQNFSFSYATNFYKDDLEIFYSQNIKSLLNEKPDTKQNNFLTIEDTKTQITQMSPSIPDALLPFHINIHSVTLIPVSHSAKTGIQIRIPLNIDIIPSEVWIHIASYLHYSTSQLHQVNHYFFEVVTSYPVIALLKTSEYLQSLESDKSEYDKEQRDKKIQN